jgi:carotenoid cleavage dioxygenase-like enzyme
MIITQLFPKVFPEPNEYLNYQLGNTSLVFHNKRILALMEGGMPFQTHVSADGVVNSVGTYDFDGSLADATSGHPKVCPLTGELHSFFYRCG